MATGGVQRLVTLPPAPDSAGHARRFVSEVLGAAAADAFVDTATLLTSELVTNGIVHAHTDLRIVVEATATWVRIEVSDDNPHLPIRRDYDEAAVTGRGLEMVELLADDFGMEPIEGDGKRVWFRLGVTPGTREPEPPAYDEKPLATFPLRLPSLPVDLYCVFQQHAEAMLREAVISSLDEDSPTPAGEFPLAGQALAALADAAGEVFALRDRHVAVADVVLPVAQSSLPLFPILREMLGRAATMSEAGQLLVPPSLPEIQALRNWICDEAARQSAGLAPNPWSGLSSDDAVAASASVEALSAVRASGLSLIAADAANRIVAVSASAAALLGWSVDELEGRRLVTIIPSRLRDRHVAGFTRHLLEGTSRVMGRPMAVTALRRDGSEVPVSLLIERRVDPHTRALFVAALDPA